MFLFLLKEFQSKLRAHAFLAKFRVARIDINHDVMPILALARHARSARTAKRIEDQRAFREIHVEQAFHETTGKGGFVVLACTRIRTRSLDVVVDIPVEPLAGPLVYRFHGFV